MFSLKSKGDYRKTRNFLKKTAKGEMFSGLDAYGRMGIEALSQATPVDSGLTADSWEYRIVQDSNGPGIEWFNTNEAANGTPVAILIQYGHATRSGSYVIGRDYINPAMQPLFDQIAIDIWEKVKEA